MTFFAFYPEASTCTMYLLLSQTKDGRNKDIQSTVEYSTIYETDANVSPIKSSSPVKIALIALHTSFPVTVQRTRFIATKAKYLFPEVSAPDYFPKLKKSKKGKKGKVCYL